MHACRHDQSTRIKQRILDRRHLLDRRSQKIDAQELRESGMLLGLATASCLNHAFAIAADTKQLPQCSGHR